MATILVIDDDVDVRTIIVQVLKEAGHQTFSAANGKEGTRHIRAIQPDLIITDLFMPEQEGLEAITDLHKNFSYIRILAISGGSVASPAMLSVARELGATHTLEKPFDKDSLLAAVERVLRTTTPGAEPNFPKDCAGPILPESD